MPMRSSYFLLIILLITISSGILAHGDNDYIKFTLYRDKYVVDMSLTSDNGVSSVFVSGVMGNRNSLIARLQFYATDKVLQSLLSSDKINIEFISIRAQRYSRFSLYKLNGTIRAKINDKQLELILVFDVLVSGNSSIGEIEVKGTITPVSSNRELNLMALAVMEDVVKYFFRTLENMSLGLIETRRISIEHIPTSRGISARVDAVLEINELDNAWRNIVGNFINPIILDYTSILFDNRLRDYALGLELKVKDDTLSGNITILFDKKLEELLNLNHTILSSDFVIVYYEELGRITLNISNMVLKPQDEVGASLHEIGELFHYLIGNISLPVIVISVEREIDTSKVLLEPCRLNKSYVEWNTSEALLYLDKIIVSEKQQSFNYLLVVLTIIIAGISLFYIVRRVS